MQSEQVDIRQCAHTNHYPQQGALYQGLDAYCLQYITRQRGTDKEQSDSQRLAGQRIDSLPNHGTRFGSAQHISIENHSQHKEEDEPGNTDFLSFTLKDERSYQSQRNNP